MPGKYYITTAIDYANSSPHIGTAYEKISADVFARFHRLIGEEVYFQMVTMDTYNGGQFFAEDSPLETLEEFPYENPNAAFAGPTEETTTEIEIERLRLRRVGRCQPMNPVSRQGGEQQHSGQEEGQDHVAGRVPQRLQRLRGVGGDELVEQPFARLIKERKLMAYRYDGFWRAMDTFKDKKKFDDMYESGERIWEVWNLPA